LAKPLDHLGSVARGESFIGLPQRLHLATPGDTTSLLVSGTPQGQRTACAIPFPSHRDRNATDDNRAGPAAQRRRGLFRVLTCRARNDNLLDFTRSFGCGPGGFAPVIILVNERSNVWAAR